MSLISKIQAWGIVAAIGGLSQCRAATFYVATTGNDANPGSQGSPVRTIQRAMALASAGDTVLVGAGQYPETVTTTRNATTGQRIIVDGQNSASILRFIFRHTFVTLQNMTVSGFTNSFNRLVWIDRNAHQSIVSNCVVDGVSAPFVSGVEFSTSATKPFGTDAPSNCLVISNRITGLLSATGLIVAGDNNVIQGNFVYELGQCDFVRMWGRNNLITGNTFDHIFAVPGFGNHIDFIQTFGENATGSKGHIIERNRVSRVDGGQITQLEAYGHTADIRDWTFRNNLFRDVDAGASCSIEDVKYFNNTFYRCSKGLGTFALTFGRRVDINTATGLPFATNNANGLRLINNVFLDCGDLSDNKGWYSVNTNLTDVLVDYNYVSNNGFRPVRVGSSPPGTIGYDAFKFFELHGRNGGDPGFQSVAGLDFRLKPTSPLIDVGSSLVGVTLDLAGVARPQGMGMDIGAFEHDLGGTVTGLPPSPPRNLRIVGP